MDFTSPSRAQRITLPAVTPLVQQSITFPSFDVNSSPPKTPSKKNPRVRQRQPEKANKRRRHSGQRDVPALQTPLNAGRSPTGFDANYDPFMAPSASPSRYAPSSPFSEAQIETLNAISVEPSTDFRDCSSPCTNSLLLDDSESSPSNEVPHASNSLDNENYEDFVEAVLVTGTCICRITSTLFAVRGWDRNLRMTTHRWYHLEYKLISEAKYVVCVCTKTIPQQTSRHPCVHVRFMQEYGIATFPDDFADAENPVILFDRNLVHLNEGDGVYENHFSVAQRPGQSLRQRAFVSFTGEDSGPGTWLCQYDVKSADCRHICAARKFFLGLKHEHSPEPTSETSPEVLPDLASTERGSHCERAVSHLSRPVPLWARISLDVEPINEVVPEAPPPSIIRIGDTASCFCKTQRHMYDQTRPLRLKDCIVYTSKRAYPVRIEVQACPGCNRTIGPDCKELGLFNFNNGKIFTHRLLNNYINCFISSETPFNAWVAVVSREYAEERSSLPFSGEAVFRAAWFAYVMLLKLQGDMLCPICGPYPETVIWDGITLGFQLKYLLRSLRPPTLSHEDSVSRPLVQYIYKQSFIEQRDLRKLLRKLVTEKRHLKNSSIREPSSESGSDDENLHRVPGLSASELLDQAKSIREVVARLTSICPGLGELFDRHFGLQAREQRITPPESCVQLFIQLSAEESALQIITRPAALRLHDFNQDPVSSKAAALLEIPAVLRLLDSELAAYGYYSASCLEVCRWLHIRYTEVYNKFGSHTLPHPDPNLESTDAHWSDTGCFYGLPKVRHRPVYPGLKHDRASEKKGNRGTKCSKYYAQYKKKPLTGGIMCAWCPHSVSYGFHCIPNGEGRNDVFSAMVTRWEIAPKRVIYDFACSLGPYCLLREPEFFSDTLFLIDDFHSSDHTKCSPAAFLKTYAASDDRLFYLNSSAAESGNSGLARIRKSVRYLGQKRAIIFTKIFLSFWNRMRIRAMEARESNSVSEPV